MPITFEMVEQAYADTGLEWAEGEWVSTQWGPGNSRIAYAACAIGVLAYAKDPNVVYGSDSDGMIATAKQWNGEPTTFYLGVVDGNDGNGARNASFVVGLDKDGEPKGFAAIYMRHTPGYREATPEEIDAYHRGYMLGQAVRQAYYVEPEDEDEEDEG